MGKEGLVPPSGRTAGGFRLDTDDDIERLRLVKQMKPLDFSLEQMRDLLGVRGRLAAGAEREPLIASTLAREVSRSRRALGSRP